MARIKVTTMIGERLTTVEVDQALLEQTMLVTGIFAKLSGKHSGEQTTILTIVNGKPVEEKMSYDKWAVKAAIELTPQPRETIH